MHNVVWADRNEFHTSGYKWWSPRILEAMEYEDKNLDISKRLK